MAWIDEETLSAKDYPSKKEVNQVLEYVSRRAKARFYADENFPAKAVAILRDVGARIKTVQETRQRRHPDENHAAYALRNCLVLLTRDKDFLDKRKFPLIHCPAIFVFDFGGGTEQEMKQAFRCLGSVFCAPQFFDKWCKVHAARDSWSEWTRYQNGQTSHARFRFWRGRLQRWID